MLFFFYGLKGRKRRGCAGKTSRVCVAPAVSANLLSLNDGRQWIVAGLVCLDPDVPVNKRADEQVPVKQHNEYPSNIEDG